jgi:hypothetical protein
MSHIHWVARQNKLETPNDEEEVNTREIHKCDGQAHDPDTMVAPLTPKVVRGCKNLFFSHLKSSSWRIAHNSDNLGTFSGATAERLYCTCKATAKKKAIHFFALLSRPSRS